MQKLILRGVKLRYYDGRNDEGGHYVRLYMSADCSEPVREAMGWSVGTVSSGKLVPNSIIAKHIILTPDEATLRAHEINLDVSSMDDFQYFLVKDENGEKTSAEIRFVVRTPVVGAETQCGNYMRYAGATAQMRVNYEKQDSLALEEAAPKEPKQRQIAAGSDTHADAAGNVVVDGPCISCNNGIPLAEGDPTIHVSGAACAAYEGHDDGAAPLATATVMNPRPDAAAKQRRTRLINEKKDAGVPVH